MKANVKINIDVDRIMRTRGMGSDNRVRRFIASQVKRLSDPYVPMQTGTLKNTAVVSDDGSTLTYMGPYAHYQWYGEVMAGSAPKHYTGRILTHTDPMRGAHWVERAMADKSADLVRALRAYIGKLGG